MHPLLATAEDRKQLLSDICGVDKKPTPSWVRMTEYNASMCEEENKQLIEGWEEWARFQAPTCNNGKHLPDTAARWCCRRAKST